MGKAAITRNPARNFIVALTIVAAGSMAYSNTFQVPFLFDDIARIVNEPSLRTVWPPWLAMHNSNRPLAHYTFALNYWWDAYNVVGYHVVNLFIHLAAAVVLFGLVRRSLLRCDTPYRQRATLIAFACGLIWAVHPLNTQAVTYIVQRLESLMGLAYLATLYCFIRAQDSRWPWLWSLASIGVCAFGMGCKEVMATAPLVVLWYDRVFVASSWRELFAKRWGYYASLAASWSVLAWSMLHYTVDYTGGALLNVEGLTPWTYLLTQSGVILHYLRLAFWPDAQCVYYAWPIATSISDVALPLIVMVGLFLATIVAAYRIPRIGFLAGCFFVLLGPTSSIIPIKDLAFEHRMYLPLAAIVVLVLVTLVAALSRFASTDRRARIAFLTCVIPAAGALGIATFERNKVYESDVSLWTDTLEKSPQNVKVWVGLGSIYAKNKQVADATRCFTNALALEPDNVKANAIYAGLLIERGEYARAQQHLEKAFARDPGDRDAIVNMGHLLFAIGKNAEALPYFEAAIKIFPEDEELQTALVVDLSYMGEHTEALKRAYANLERRPNSARALTDLAAVLVTLGRKEDACRYCLKAIALDDSVARAHATYAVALADRDLSLALEHMSRACQQEPSSFEYQLAMGNLQMQFDPSAAIKHYEAASNLDPDNVEVLLRLGMAHDANGAPEKGLPYLERVTQLRPGLVEAREMVKAMRRTISDRAP